MTPLDAARICDCHSLTLHTEDVKFFVLFYVKKLHENVNMYFKKKYHKEHKQNFS